MTEQNSDNSLTEQVPGNVTPGPFSIMTRAGLFVLLLFCSLAVFLFGSTYYKMFPTNGNWIYAAGLSAVLLIAALLLRRSKKFFNFWPIAYAFFIASAVNLVSDMLAGYNKTIVQIFGTWPGTNPALALSKLYDALLVVIPILVLTRLSGGSLSSLFLKRGNLNRKWGLGIGALVLFNFLTSAIIFFGTGFETAKLGSAIGWDAVF